MGIFRRILLAGMAVGLCAASSQSANLQHATFNGLGKALPRISTGSTDTLEIYAIRVEFKYEETDNSLTTGRGTFGSDADTASANYSLDPNNGRGSVAYWDKHLQFARDYFRAASNGKLAVTWKIFPQSNNASSYKLDKYIIDYNRTARKKDEKVAAFDSARSRDYMNFVWDAIHKANAGDDSPFRDSLPQSPNTHRVYLIIHAGASRLVDGGSMGTASANTPGDFMDMFVSRDDWKNLAGDSLRGADSTGVLPANSPQDTLHEVMVVSETASQDGLNWGINGILVNQIGRQIGLPNTYDPVKGLSRMGYFDMMDFAGYNAGNGFLPVLPSAWLRAYMGWANVRTVSPGSDLAQALSLAAAGSGAGDEIIKVPLTADEYLLIENRQRSIDAAGMVTINLDNGSSRTVLADSINTIFQDSTCNASGVCKANAQKAKGIITSMSSYDAALPASGVAVWHVNEWFLKQYLKFGLVNFWSGDTARDHQYGIELVEADGILSIGKQFKNMMGQAAYDYGSGADLLPHARTHKDTVQEILPTGYANTSTTFGGLSGIRLTVGIPSGATAEKTANTFIGDSVTTWRAKTFPVRVEWNNQWMANSQWPKQTIAYNTPSHILALDRPQGYAGQAKKLITVGSLDGSLQIFAPNGDTVTISDTTVLRDRRMDSVTTLLETSYSIDSANHVRMYRLDASHGALVGMASSATKVYSLHVKGLARNQITTASGHIASVHSWLDLPATAVDGPMLSSDGIWVADSLGLRLATDNSALNWSKQISWPANFVPQQMAICGDYDGDGVNDVAVVSTSGSIAIRKSSDASFVVLTRPEATQQRYRMVCTDFNRDGKPDAFVLGDHGLGWIVSLTDNHLIAPVRQYKRSSRVPYYNAQNKLDTLSYYENSPIAIGDVNGDGLPDAVFFGDNSIVAIDSTGVPLTGFPAKFTRGSAEYGFSESPILVDATGKGSTHILAATTAGLLYAFDSKGVQLHDSWPRAVGDFRYENQVNAPLAVGLLIADADSVDGFELFSTHHDLVNGFGFSGALARPGANWLQAGGSGDRQFYFDATTLNALNESGSVETITDFFVFPNPVRGGIAKARFTLGAPAASVTLRFYSLGGKEVVTSVQGPAGAGRNQLDQINVSHLGSDIYAVKLEIIFASGKKKQAWDRIGLVK